MKGSIFFQADRGRWALSWYHKEPGQKRGTSVVVTKYKGQHMPCSAYKMKSGRMLLDDKNRPIPDKAKCQGYKLAEKLKSAMQSRKEQEAAGLCVFRIEEFTGDGWTDVIEFYNEWIADVVVHNSKPSTIKCYKSYGKIWIGPFFSQYNLRLHEIKKDMLLKFTQHILKERRKKAPDKNVGKYAKNILGALRTCLEYARDCERIPNIPPFPGKKDFQLKKNQIEWMSEAAFKKVMAKIPEPEQPIFWFLHYHYRRPGEACVLKKTDYDQINSAFWIRAALSDRQETDSTKTGEEFYVPCDPRFTNIVKTCLKERPESVYLFTNPRARKNGKRWTLESLRKVWYDACDAAGIKRIWVYKAAKHTACTEYLNNGGTLEDLSLITGQTIESLRNNYADITLDRKRAAMAKGSGVVDFGEMKKLKQS